MSLYILDTDHVTLFQQGHLAVTERIIATPSEALAVTVITAEEQLRGWFAAIRQASSGSKLVWAYAGLRRALDYFGHIQLLDFTPEALTRYEELRQQKIRIGTQDLRIAAIVLAVNGILVTRNQRDFSLIPGLTFQDWTKP